MFTFSKKERALIKQIMQIFRNPDSGFVKAMEQANGKALVLLLGPTGVGKSTLGSYLFGTRYIRQGIVDYDEQIICCEGTVAETFKRGISNVESETLYPQALQVDGRRCKIISRISYQR